MRRYRTSPHTRYDLKVHLIWSTKYRHPVLEGELGHRIRQIIRQICKEKDIEIIRGRISQDHIHLYISYPPKFSISDLIKSIKGRSSRKIQQEFPELGRSFWGRHFWAIGYAAFSSGLVTDEMIRDYLDRHSSVDNDDFVVE